MLLNNLKEGFFFLGLKENIMTYNFKQVYLSNKHLHSQFDKRISHTDFSYVICINSPTHKQLYWLRHGLHVKARLRDMNLSMSDCTSTTDIGII
jgi:hypothetical protein